MFCEYPHSIGVVRFGAERPNFGAFLRLRESGSERGDGRTPGHFASPILLIAVKMSLVALLRFSV